MSSVTKDYKSLHQLTIQQERAINLITAGMTDQETAEAVGKHRVTITRWRLYDPHFQAAFNERRQEITGRSTERLRAMVPRLIAVIEQQLDEKELEVKTAIQLLKMLKLDAGFDTGIGPVDAEEIIEQQVQERLAEKIKDRKKYQTSEEGLAEIIDPSGLREIDQQALEEARTEVLDEIENKLSIEPEE